jgi:hypothetical protein
MTPEHRSMRGQIASYTSWARTTDRSARTAPARAAARSRFETQVDPDGTMDPAERAKRAEAARKAHFRQMAYKSARARAQRKAGGA